MSALCASKNDNYPLYRSHERAAPSRSSTLKIIMNAIELLLADVRNWDLRRQFIISASFICQTVLKYFLCLDAELIAAMILSESQRRMQKLIRSGSELSLSILRSLTLRGPSEVGVCFSHSEVGNADAELRQNMSIRRNLLSEMFTLLFRILNILIGCC